MSVLAKYTWLNLRLSLSLAEGTVQIQKFLYQILSPFLFVIAELCTHKNKISMDMTSYESPSCVLYTVATAPICTSPNSFNLGGGGNYDSGVIYDNGEY